MKNIFTKHPKEVNETYLEHMWCAIKFSFKLEYLAFCAFIHAIFPFLEVHKKWNLECASKWLSKKNKNRELNKIEVQNKKISNAG